MNAITILLVSALIIIIAYRLLFLYWNYQDNKDISSFVKTLGDQK